MRHTRIMHHSFLLAICLTWLPFTAFALNRRHITVKDGLSNMSILSLMQDSDGYIWAGSCDGVNRIENKKIQTYGAGNNNTDEFSGNLIESIRQDSSGVMWIHTNYGLDRFNHSANTVEYFRNITGSYRDAITSSGKTIVATSANKLLYFTPESGKFHNIGNLPNAYSDLKDLMLSDNGDLWIADTRGINHIKIDSSCDTPAIKGNPQRVLDQYIYYADAHNNAFYYITNEYDLYSYDTLTKRNSFIASIESLLNTRSGVSAILPDGEDFIITFKSYGAVRLKPSADHKRFVTIPFDIDCGVFTVLKDRNQGTLWFGTDGDGIYYYFNCSYRFHSQTTAENHKRISQPVRALLTDNQGNLWAATKGAGLLCYHNFTPGSDNTNVSHYTRSNSALNNDDVYALAPSRHNIFWIGTQGTGLCYYSIADKTIRHISIHEMPRFQSVHAIEETAPDELWVATVGEGVFRIRFAMKNGKPTMTDIDEIVYDKKNSEANAFFCINVQNDSIIWFGNRGFGAYRYNRLSNHLKILDFNEKGAPPANDVFNIYIPDAKCDTVFCATSIGLIKTFPSKDGGYDYKMADTQSSLAMWPAKTIHATLNGGGNGNIMLASTNFGILRYDCRDMSVTTYLSGTDFNVSQFSDGAAWRDKTTGNLYFGASDGFVVLVPDDNPPVSNYAPPVLFRSITLNNETRDIAEYLNQGKLVLSYSHNTFTIRLGALDYIHGADYSYRYRLKGTTEEWIDNSSGEIQFNNLHHGNYILEVYYVNGIVKSPVYSIPIRITPPFYATSWAFAIYVILMIAAIALLLLYTVKVQHRKRNQIIKTLEQKRKEEIYESKLKFFTNITHELFTPLTLISGSCERILGSGNLDIQTHRLTSMIQKNAGRLTELIQELIEFRRIDTEYRKPDVEKLDVSLATEEIADGFTMLAEKKNIKFYYSIEPDILWPTDRSGFITIVNNLMSNALKYTDEQGEIKLTLKTDNNLILTVANTGQGIAPENLGHIFDRYKVLERFERLSAAGTVRRNGLGLAVCAGLAKLLQGEIKVESDQGQWTTFTVTLPVIEVTRQQPSTDNIHYQKTILPQLLEREPQLDNKALAPDSVRPLVFIVDDDKEMLWFIADSLRDTYNVMTFENADDAEKELQKEHPGVIITDVLMAGTNGIEFTRQIKANKATSHIPVIQLSSLHSEADKIRAIEAGADIYLTKPFNIDYLRSVIAGMLKRKKDLKEYYDSSLSAFDVIGGKIIHKEDSEFREKLVKLINDNLKNPELSTRFVAEQLGMSVRNLYRRLESFTEITPVTIIREIRLEHARNLLAKTNLSIDEVLYQSGFNNRGTFFKIFQQKYGTTPKQYREAQVSTAQNNLHQANDQQQQETPDRQHTLS